MTSDNCIRDSVIIAVLLNLLLPAIVKPYATPEEIKPPHGADKLPFKSQIVHMLVHHAQVPITSSLIIAAIVGLSVFLHYKITEQK